MTLTEYINNTDNRIEAEKAIAQELRKTGEWAYFVLSNSTEKSLQIDLYLIEKYVKEGNQ